MVKIKTEKEFTLPELIQWCWDNDITFKTFFGLYVPKAFYMLNEDYTMTLIWRNGGMVE